MPTIFPFLQTPFITVITQLSFDNSTVKHLPFQPIVQNYQYYQWSAVETRQVDWLIYHFNQWFSHHETILVRGDDAPEYFAKTTNEPAKIVFAHGFFASALHEISHWCVAGKKRRQFNDFGYWYAPDGRSETEQQLFEKVEIIPQAIECLFTLSCGKKFRVSQDNLFADFDTSQSTFSTDVQQQAIQFWQTGEKLPTDAKILLSKLQILRPFPITLFDIYHNFE